MLQFRKRGKSSMEIRKLYINGEWVDSVHDEWIEIENPATHEIIAKVPSG